MYFFTQPTGESAWQLQDASLRARIISGSNPPAFVTVLDTETPVVDGMTREEEDAVRYRGPWYADIDAENIHQGQQQFNRLLDKLEAHGVCLDQCRLYATGGRGFHIEVPMEVFCLKAKAVPFLPAIYKEMAFQVFVDCLDMRVYSARRGRMWRTVNVQRPNGLYKVQITPAEARAMTEENYAEICARMRQPWEPEAPELATGFSSLWVTAQASIAQGLKKRKEAVKDEVALQRFGGGWPPSLLRLMQGELHSATGWNDICLQISVTANLLGKKHEEVLGLCAPLIASHQSDGTRYNTEKARWRRLREALRYTEGNPRYNFSIGGLIALMPEGADITDLTVQDSGAAADEPPPDYAGASQEPAGAEGPDSALQGSETDLRYDRISRGLKITESAVVVNSADGTGKHLTNARFLRGHPLLSMEGRIIAYECQYVVDGSRVVDVQVPLDALLTARAFAKLMMPYGIVWQGNDAQTMAYGRLHQLNCPMAEAEYMTPREGVDILTRPGVRGSCDVVWAATDCVQKHASKVTSTDVNYRFRGLYTAGGMLKSDLHHAPSIAEHADDVFHLVDALLDLNDPNVIGNMLGWCVACFFRQFHHKGFGQFPLLMAYGEAGSGKTTTVELLSTLFYFENKPLILQTAGTTLHALQGTMVSSASIPILLDEYKPRQMPPGLHNKLLTLFRGSYNAGDLAKGGMAEDPSNWREVGRMTCAAPLLIIAEAVETETATLERTITVAFQKPANDARREALVRAEDYAHAIPILGRAVMMLALSTELSEFKQDMRNDVQAVRKEVSAFTLKDRVVYNTAAVYNGLRTLWRGLQAWLSPEAVEALQERYNAMVSAVLDVQTQASMAVMSEASKVLHTMAAMSNMDDEQRNPETTLVLNMDYVYTGESGQFLDLKVRNCYIKYVTWCRRKGFTPLYDDEDAFLHGMKHYRGLVSPQADSPLKAVDPSARVFRFSVRTLTEEGVDPFKSSM